MKKILIAGAGDISGLVAARIFAQTNIPVEVVSADIAKEQQQTKHALTKIELTPPPIFEMPFEPPMNRRQRRELERKRNKS